MKELTAVPVDPGTTIHINTGEIPDYVATNLAQVVFTEIHRAFEDPVVQEDYKRWKEERAKRQKGMCANATAT